MKKSSIYKLLSLSNDLNAIKKGKVGKRVKKKIGLKLFSKIFK